MTKTRFPAGVGRPFPDYVKRFTESTYRDSAFIAANTALLALSGFAFWLLASRSSTPEEVGRASALVGAVTFVALLGRLGLDYSLLVLLPGGSESTQARLASRAVLVAAISTSIVAVTFAAITSTMNVSVGAYLDSLWKIAVFVVTATVWATSTVLDSYLIALRSGSRLLFKTGTFAVIRVGTVATFATVLGEFGLVLACLTTVALSFVAISDFRQLWQLQGSGFLNDARTIAATAFSSLPAAFVFILPSALGPLIVLERFGEAETARFYVYWMFGALAMAVPVAIGQARLVRLRARSRANSIAGSLIAAVVAALAVTAAGLMALPLFGPHYSTGAMVPLLGYTIAAVPGAFVHHQFATARSANAPFQAVLIPLVPVSLFMALLASSPIGADAIGYAWCGSQVVGSVAGYFFWRADAA